MRASDRYELVIRRRSLLRRVPGLVTSAIAAMGGSSHGPIWPMTALLVDRRDGEVVGEIANTDGHAHDVIGVARADLIRLDGDEFGRKWLPEQQGAPARG